MEKVLKKNNHYKLSLQELPSVNNDEQKLEIAIENHDNLFSVIELAKRKSLFAGKSDAIEFALGLKLFTEVMLRNCTLPLFDELSPAIAAFMKKLKAI